MRHRLCLGHTHAFTSLCLGPHPPRPYQPCFPCRYWWQRCKVGLVASTAGPLALGLVAFGFAKPLTGRGRHIVRVRVQLAPVRAKA
eukprot:scaffold34002_cov65-Phaeocystis_antarctica.AAC.2